MKNGYVISVMSCDRPGIVAAVSSAIAKLGGNIESCSQTVLSGYFTLILMFTLPRRKSTSTLEKEFLDSDGMENCQVLLRHADLASESSEEKSSNLYVVTAFGKDKKSIVSSFSQYLAERNVNILDLYGTLTPEGEFVLISQVEVGVGQDIKNLQLDLEELGSELGYTVQLQHNNIFVATNQLRLY